MRILPSLCAVMLASVALTAQAEPTERLRYEYYPVELHEGIR